MNKALFETGGTKEMMAKGRLTYTIKNQQNKKYEVGTEPFSSEK